jgi:hypothetical protein
MPKASRVRYSGIAPYIDDTQANRVQALGSSSRLTTEDMKELGTLNIVEIVDDVPQVDVSIDQNENGTNDLLGLFSNKGYGCNVVAVPSGSAIGTSQVKVRPGSYYAGSGVGNRIIFEGADLTISGTDTQYVYLQPNVTGTKVAYGTSVPTGAIQIATLAGLAVSGGTITQADITDGRPFKQIKEIDFELAKVDVFVPVKQSGSGDAVKRTMYMERVFVNNVDFSFQVNGVATASYRLETDNKRWFLNDASQIIVDEYKATAGQTSFTLSQTPFSLANSNKTLSVVKNGSSLKEGTDFSVSGTTLSLATGATAGDLLKVRYTSATGGDFFAPVPATENPHPELAGGLKQGQIELYLTDNLNERVFRIQSARIGLPLSREQLGELGSLFPYDRPMQLPVNTSVSLELRDSDLELMARLAGKNVDTATEISLDDLVKNLGLVVKLYRETDIKRAKLPAGHPDKYAIKTFKVNNLIPQSENWDVRVDSDATQSFEFLAHNLAVSDEITA